MRFWICPGLTETLFTLRLTPGVLREGGIWRKARETYRRHACRRILKVRLAMTAKVQYK